MTLDRNVLCISRVLWLRDDDEGEDNENESSSCVQVQKDSPWPTKHTLFTRNFPKIDNIRLVYPSPIQPVKEKALKALSMGWCASS